MFSAPMKADALGDQEVWYQGIKRESQLFLVEKSF